MSSMHRSVLLLLRHQSCCLLVVDCWQMSPIHPSSLLSSCSRPRLSDWSVVFVFNASLSACAPSSPIWLSTCLCWLLAMSALHPSSVLSSCSHPRSSAVSVVLVFNASLSELAPSAPIPLSACWCWLLTMSATHPPSSLFLAHKTDPVL